MKNIIIIGGGISGLTAGIFAQKQGYSTIIIEKHNEVGGNLTGWYRDGYYIDNCIHWLTGTNKNTKDFSLLKEIGVKENFYYKENFYTVLLNGQSLSFNANPEKTRADMLKISVEDSVEINKFIDAIISITKLENLSGENADEKGSAIEKFTAIKRLFSYYNQNLNDLSNKFKHPLLKLAINGFIGGNFSSLGLLFSYACFCEKNGGIPYGGSKQMAMDIKNRYLDLGGKIITSSTVEKINDLKNGCFSVSIKDRPSLYCNNLIIATDLENAYKLLGLPLPNKVQKRLYSTEFSRFSSFHVAFSCDVNKLPFKNETILKVSEKYKPFIKATSIALREFSYELNFAPENKTVVQAMFFIDEKDSKKWINLRKNLFDYKQEKYKTASIILEIIFENFKSLKGELQILDIWTPATYNRYFGENNGSYMSNILPKGKIPITFSNKVKGYKNVVLAGQWLSTIGGLPYAVKNGYNAVKRLNKLNSPFFYPINKFKKFNKAKSI